MIYFRVLPPVATDRFIQQFAIAQRSVNAKRCPLNLGVIDSTGLEFFSRYSHESPSISKRSVVLRDRGVHRLL